MAYAFDSIRLRWNAAVLDGTRLQNSLVVWIESLEVAEYSFDVFDYLPSVEQSYLLSDLFASQTTCYSRDLLTKIRKRCADLPAIHSGVFLEHSVLRGDSLRDGAFQQHQKRKQVLSCSRKEN